MRSFTTVIQARTLLLAAALACLVVSLCLWLLFFLQYWPYRALFDAEGRYFDAASGVVVRSQSALLAVPASALLLLALLLTLLRRRARRPC